MTPRGFDHPYFSLPGPWLIAHRGGAREAPENTLPAFENAAALGADVIETDVRRSRDGVVMVFHDPDTLRITGVPGRVEDRTAAELEALDAGWSYEDAQGGHPWRGKGVRIPRLAEMLARFPGIRFNIEAKGDEPELAEDLARVLEAAGRERTACVGAEHGEQARRLKERLPDYARFLPTGPALRHFLSAWFPFIPRGWATDEYDLAAVPLRQYGVRVLSRCVVAHFHRRRMPIQVWTVDRREEMEQLLRWKVDGVMSDLPTLLKQVMGR